MKFTALHMYRMLSRTSITFFGLTPIKVTIEVARLPTPLQPFCRCKMELTEAMPQQYSTFFPELRCCAYVVEPKKQVPLYLRLSFIQLTVQCLL